MASIREIDPERDAHGVVEMAREAWPTIVISDEAWLHRLRSLPERSRHRGWVAEDRGVVVGNGFAFLNFFSDVSTTAICGVTVRESHRRHGIGSTLYELVLDHARTIGAESLLTNFHENDAGASFAAVHGLHLERAETTSVLDPRTVADKAPHEVDLRPVADVDPRLVYLADNEATRDMPATEPIDDIPYEEWEQHVLEHPFFTQEGSFVAMVDGVAAAVSLLTFDPETGRSANMFTGTLRAYRGRGLGLAVKLASIHWAAEHGATSMATNNDETNAPMLAINRRLGYRPSGRRVEYLKHLG